MILIPWSNGFLSVAIKDSPGIVHLEPAYPPPLQLEDIRAAVHQDLAILAQPLKNAGRIVLILEDPSRPSDTRILTETILNGIKEIRGSLTGFNLVVASGAHYRIAPRHLRRKVDRFSWPIIIHDCQAENQLLSVGTSRAGIPLFFNQAVVRAHLRLSISTVNIHPLAGFSGGGKILLPGVAGLKTIYGFHSMPPGKSGVHHSAMRELIDEVTGLLPIDYSWHLISRPDGTLVKIHSGPTGKSYAHAKQTLLNIAACPRPVNKFSLLLLGCNPFDQNLTGTFKSLSQIPPLLQSGGCAVLFNEASQGTGFHHWRNDPRVIAAQKNYYRNLLQDYQVAVYSPITTPVHFQNLFPDEFSLLSSEAMLSEFITKRPVGSVAVLPYAPVTLIE